ncbi:transmembrane protein 106A isoform X2 [Rissa tridactyla]|uniref:transmembrane protein 106A isoform X2 n=1 Tax=Rissa tridactyla TaxID=75485 RepID=UPI0023BAE9CE|nr:transmembrane protein 106A isoform X2 [Rissa tridactyla]
MGGELSRLWKTPDQKESEDKLILPRQLDAGDEIANYASINDSATSCVGIARQSCINCPTCRGTGRIPGEQEKELVALIPYGDQRLKPRRTKLYVCLAVTICLLTTSLSIFFLFPRSIAVLPAGLTGSSIGFDANTTSMYLNMTNVLNITNNNFYVVTVVQLDMEVLHQSLVVGKTTVKTLLNMNPLQSGQIHYMVASTISDDNTYNICTWTKVNVHNILLHIHLCPLEGSPCMSEVTDSWLRAHFWKTDL